MSMRAVIMRAVAGAAGVYALACATGCESTASWEPADREFGEFQELFPVLIRDCGFHTCHGSSDRFFRVYGPGRVRLESDTLAYDRVTGNEVSASFQLALSMIDDEQPERSLLLRKPLAIEAGGVSHGGTDSFGRDVYRTTRDEGYVAIERFVLGAPPDEDEAAED